MNLKKKESEHEANVRRGRNSKRKGANYERTIAKLFQKVYGVELKRTPQSGGFAKKSSKADDFRGDVTIVDEDLTLTLHIECKNCKTWTLKDWLNQAEEDSPKGKVPIVVFHEYNKSNNYVCLSLEDFMKLVPREKILKEREKK